MDIGKHDNGTLGIRAELRVHVPGWPAADVEKLIKEVKKIGAHCAPRADVGSACR